MTVRLICGCCAHIEVFDSYRGAYKAGWDGPDRFGYTACNLCPGAFVYFSLLYAQEARETANPELRATKLANAAAYSHMHDEAHARWATEGRPASFEHSMGLGDVPLPPKEGNGG